MDHQRLRLPPRRDARFPGQLRLRPGEAGPVPRAGGHGRAARRWRLRHDRGRPTRPGVRSKGDLDPQGNLPRDFVRDAVAAGARWAKLKAGQPEALVLPGRGPLQVLAVVARKVDYQARFPFQDIVRDAVLEKAPAAVAK